MSMLRNFIFHDWCDCHDCFYWHGTGTSRLWSSWKAMQRWHISLLLGHWSSVSLFFQNLRLCIYNRLHIQNIVSFNTCNTSDYFKGYRVLWVSPCSFLRHYTVTLQMTLLRYSIKWIHICWETYQKTPPEKCIKKRPDYECPKTETCLCAKWRINCIQPTSPTQQHIAPNSGTSTFTGFFAESFSWQSATYRGCLQRWHISLLLGYWSSVSLFSKTSNYVGYRVLWVSPCSFLRHYTVTLQMTLLKYSFKWIHICWETYQKTPPEKCIKKRPDYECPKTETYLCTKWRINCIQPTSPTQQHTVPPNSGTSTFTGFFAESFSWQSATYRGCLQRWHISLLLGYWSSVSLFFQNLKLCRLSRVMGISLFFS